MVQIPVNSSQLQIPVNSRSALASIKAKREVLQASFSMSSVGRRYARLYCRYRYVLFVEEYVSRVISVEDIFM